ncbi:mucin-19-like [Thrips palmi]|uniref:Mucin-19-like n=1 Tax=Thrips palmi TaxID=161013 RepID=A0A6P9ADZ9_THRPL|nr:mucin-19-like [Thrips palmi]
MLRSTGSTAVAVLVAVLLAASVQGVPEQQAPSPAGKAPFSFGPTYDEIVVETQLAVRPKVSSAGLSLRSGRAKAPKAVYFRPNATASGAEVRHITPLVASASTTTPSDGISFAARVVSEENPLAVERARKAAAAARARRESNKSTSSFSSSSHSFRSSSSGGGSGPAGAASSAPAPPAAPPSTSSHSSGSSSRTYTRQLADGRTVTVTETDEFHASLGPDTKAPTASRLLTVLVGSQ